MGRRSTPGVVAAGKGIFIHNPRTAGTSIASVLGCWDSHDTAWELRLRYGFKRWSNAITFGYVRNPWARAVSWFKYNHGSTDVAQFQEWAAGGCHENWQHYNWVNKRVHPLRQVEYFVGQGGVIVDHIGRFENLEEDFAAVCALLEVEATLNHAGRTSPTNYQSFYDPASRDAIAKLDRWVILKFHYTFDGG